MTAATGNGRPEALVAIPVPRPPSPVAVAEGIARWLLANQQADGRIVDTVHGEHGTYADGFAALVFALMAQRTGETEWEPACRRSLAVATRRPIESEFDSFALLLLATTADGRRRTGEPWRLLAADSRRLVSNNWVAMRAASYSLRARLTRSDADKREADRLWHRVLAWQTADELFVDSPGGEATPVTYHAKFCAMLALEARFGERPHLREPLRKGLDALAGLVSPSGVLVPYGRSRNTLFGSVAAIYALRIGFEAFANNGYADAASRMLTRLASFQREDGHVPCVLNDGESEKRDWDVYVSNPDYNAYAAALLLMTDDGRPKTGHVTYLTPVLRSPSPVAARIGPILTIRTPDSYAAFVTTGQSVPIGTPFFCDHRYYGMQPLLIERGGKVELEPAPYTWSGGEDRRALVDPSANAWLPYVEDRGDRYCVRRYDEVAVRTVDDSVELIGEGVPVHYTPVMRWQRAIKAVLVGWAGRPQPVFTESKLRGVRLSRRLRWDAATGRLTAASEVMGQLPVDAALHQSSHD